MGRHNVPMQTVEPMPVSDDVRAARERLTKLAWLLDSCIAVPGTKFTIGVEALLGLLPVVGDAIGALFGAAIVFEANRLGVPRRLQWRMAANVAIDTALGAVPLLGDVFDLAYKANRRNVNLLLRHIDRVEGVIEPRSGPAPALLLAIAGCLLGAFVAFVILHA